MTPAHATVRTGTSKFAYPAKRSTRPVTDTPSEILMRAYPALLDALRDARFNRIVEGAPRTLRIDLARKAAWCGGQQGTVLYTVDSGVRGLEADCQECLDQLAAHLTRLARH